VKVITLGLLFLIVAANPVIAQSPQYAGDPLTLGAGARALSMGGAYVALSSDATAIYWNPAGLGQSHRREIHIQHAEQFGGTINHDVAAFSLPFAKGGVGLSIVRAGIDEIALTTLEDVNRPLGPDNRPIVTEIVGTTNYVFRLAYGKQLTEKWRLGTGFKIIRRNLHLGVGNGVGLDLGVLYLPTSALRLGATLYDLTKTRIAFPNGITDRISPSLLIGSAINHTVPGGHLTLGLSTRFNDKKSKAEKTRSIQLGAEYRIHQHTAFRLGYREGHFTAGAGLQLRRFGVDLAFLEHDQLDNTYRISATLFF